MIDTRPLLERGMESEKETEEKLQVRLLREVTARYAGRIKALAEKGRMGQRGRFVRWTTDGRPVITRL